MAASIFIEEESGTSTGWIHPHNGYYAGDFRDVPVRLPRPSLPTTSTPRTSPPRTWHRSTTTATTR